MRAIDRLPAALRARSRSPRRVILGVDDARGAIDALAGHGWEIVAVTPRWEDGGKDLRSERPVFLPGWSRVETWDGHVEHTRRAAHAALDGCTGWAELEARAGTPHVAAADAIVASHFPGDESRIVVPADASSVPLVSARLERATRSFTAGQRVLIHDVYFGMNERAQVLGRYRRKHRWIAGVVPIDALTDARPRVIHEPAVVRALAGASIPRGLFTGRFWPMPGGP